MIVLRFNAKTILMLLQNVFYTYYKYVYVYSMRIVFQCPQKYNKSTLFKTKLFNHEAEYNSLYVASHINIKAKQGYNYPVIAYVVEVIMTGKSKNEETKKLRVSLKTIHMNGPIIPKSCSYEFISTQKHQLRGCIPLKIV